MKLKGKVDVEIEVKEKKPVYCSGDCMYVESNYELVKCLLFGLLLDEDDTGYFRCSACREAFK